MWKIKIPAGTLLPVVTRMMPDPLLLARARADDLARESALRAVQRRDGRAREARRAIALLRSWRRRAGAPAAR